MTKKELIEYINKSDFWIAEGPVVFNMCYPWAFATPDSKRYFDFGFDKELVAYKGDYGYQFLDKTENAAVTKGLVASYIQGDLSKKYSLWKKQRETAIESFKYLDSLDLKGLTDEKLVREYLNFMDIFTEQWTIPIILEGAAIYTERHTLPKFREENKNLERKIVDEHFSVLAQPDSISFNNQERLEFLMICQKAAGKKLGKLGDFKKKETALYNSLAEHQKKYHWIRNNYVYAKPIKVSGFFDLLKEELKNKNLARIKQEIAVIKNYKKTTLKNKKAVLAELKLSGPLKKEIEATSFFGFWQDERKEMNLRGNYYIGLFLDEFCRRTKIVYFDLSQMLPKEISRILKEGKRKWLPVLRERKKKMITMTVFKKGMDLFVGKDAEEIWENMFRAHERDNDAVMIEGITVSKGGKDSIKGTASIVLDPTKDKFKAGDILITSMTRPEFVPLMKKASAIVTNEGGMTCHAAIISRELNIPCIVGTKQATRIFKNGDNLELKLNHGRVQKI